MKNKITTRLKQMVAPWLFVGVPTIALGFILLLQVNRLLTLFQNDWIKQGVFFGLGITAAIFFYSQRFRFLLISFLVYVLGGIVFRLVNQLPFGESFAFDLSIGFYIYGTLFFGGFILAFALLRWRIVSVLWGLLLLVLFIVQISRTQSSYTGAELATIFLVIFFYGFYIVLTTELLRNIGTEQNKRYVLLLRKTTIGCSILLLLTIIVGLIFWKPFNELADRLAQAHFDNKDNETSMTKRNKDGSMSNDDRLNLTGGLSKNKTLVFVAHLNNFFEDSITPNPLYFTAFYYNKFDAESQSFLADDSMPSNDLFKPNPAAIPLYFNKIDTNVVRNTKATIKRKIATAEVYKVTLGSEDFLAPSTAFLCQPISVPKDYQKQFKSAYRAQMWVSELNSAYFVYNSGKEMGMEIFQRRRFDALRQAADYNHEDPKFMQYYTQYPKQDAYKKIANLAHQIGDDKPTVMDKMLAIRDYFLQKDANGKPLFQYSDNPGLPGIPTASKLEYFLFQNRKGYCAYYAGATLMMLRALGIPSRIAAGFMTVDRSNKNPGWYWYYADQAHAWVQVYFPGYGWMDFDTTIPDENTQQAPQPDGTPPLGNLQTYFVGDGTITHINNQTREVDIKLQRFIIQQKTYDANPPVNIAADASQAKVTMDTGTVDFSRLQTGMHVTAASSAESLKELKATETDQPNELLKQLPNPVPVDEIKIVMPESEKKKNHVTEENAAKSASWVSVVGIVGVLLIVLLLLFYTLPFIVFQYLKSKAKMSVYYSFQASLFYLNQLGYSQVNESPSSFAERMDKLFGTDYTKFSNIYQQYKYSKQPLTSEEHNFAQQFLPNFIQKIKQKIPFKQRFVRFLNPFVTMQFRTKK
ncbi:MAG: transglutaminase-like domain-containing protein [Chitinophagaceae bacterium]